MKNRNVIVTPQEIGKGQLPAVGGEPGFAVAYALQSGYDKLVVPGGEQYWRPASEAAKTHVSLLLRSHNAVVLEGTVFPELEDLEREVDPNLLDDSFSYVGRHRPELLFVGEKHSGDGNVDVGFFGAFNPWGGCGAFLLGQFSRQDWSRWALVNSQEGDLANVWERVGQPPVVALGITARNSCLTAGIPHARVQHPAYVQRWSRNDTGPYGLREYGNRIAEAVETEFGMKLHPQSNFHNNSHQ